MSFNFIQASAKGALMESNSRTKMTKTGKCLREPTYIEDGGSRFLTCAEPEKDKKEGNFVEYKRVNDALTIISVRDDYCKPVTTACQCNPLLDAMFARLPVEEIERIDTRVDKMKFMDGCVCYLSASARQGFFFVEMAGTKPECTEVKAFSTEFLPTYNTCKSYVDNQCGNQLMTIIKY